MAVQVALVDDEQVARAYVESLSLWRQGEFELAISAGSAQELLSALALKPVDIVLMDVFMPEVNGVTLSGEIARLYPQTDVVAISNFDGYDYVRPIMKNGAQDYLLKSRLTDDSLLELLRRLRSRRTCPVPEDSHYRRQLRRFLRGEASWPFPQDGSQALACFGRLADSPSLSRAQRDSMQRGVEDLMEAGSTPALRRTAVCCRDGLFLLILRFENGLSIAAMQQQAHYICTTIADSVASVYKAPLHMEMGPVMANASALPAYILQRVARTEPAQPVSQESLSLSDQQRLLTLMSAGEQAALCAALEEILLPLKDRAPRERLFICRSVMDLLRSAAHEWQVELPLPREGNEQFAWMWQFDHPSLIAQLQRLFSELLTLRRKQVLTQYSEVVQRALCYLEASYAGPVSLSAAARAVGVNESYLSRLFRKETGMTFSDYLTQLRLSAAKELLAQGLPIKQVASEVGYVQYTHFLRVFKQKEGCTIKQYLNKSKNG
ncbi:MAG: DNA-binding response regulator [Aristaeellaceae bacterium]